MLRWVSVKAHHHWLGFGADWPPSSPRTPGSRATCAGRTTPCLSASTRREPPGRCSCWALSTSAAARPTKSSASRSVAAARKFGPGARAGNGREWIEATDFFTVKKLRPADLFFHQPNWPKWRDTTDLGCHYLCSCSDQSQCCGTPFATCENLKQWRRGNSLSMGFSCFEDESKRMCCSPKVVNGSRDILRRSFSCLRISITVLHEERSNASSFSFCEKSCFFSPENRLPPKFDGKSSCSQQSNFPLGLNPPILGPHCRTLGPNAPA